MSVDEGCPAEEDVPAGGQVATPDEGKGRK